MRLRQIAAGNGTPQEMFLMVSEKIDAAAEARTIMLRAAIAISYRPLQENRVG
jgi:hypothetical protein